MEDVLMQVVEEFAAFVDLASEEDIKPSCAQWGRERLKTILRQLSDPQKQQVAAFLKQELKESSGSYSDWLQTLPTRLALIDATEGSAS